VCAYACLCTWTHTRVCLHLRARAHVCAQPSSQNVDLIDPVPTFASQVAERKRLEEEEKAADQRVADALTAQQRADKEAARKAAADERVRKRAALAEKETAMRQETRLRFQAANDVLEARDSQLHSSVLSGAKAAFNYFSGRIPVQRSAGKA
jgi:hypothetical protein